MSARPEPRHARRDSADAVDPEPPEAFDPLPEEDVVPAPARGRRLQPVPEAAPPPPSTRPLVTARVTRGVMRLLRSLHMASVTEVALANGRRADVLGIDGDGCLTIVEVKSCAADLRADQKWPDYSAYCDRFYFAVPETLPLEILPDTIGVILADAYGGMVLREPLHHPLSTARRRAMMIRVARLGAMRLHDLADPHLRDGIDLG